MSHSRSSWQRPRIQKAPDVEEVQEPSTEQSDTAPAGSQEAQMLVAHCEGIARTRQRLPTCQSACCR